MNDIKNKLLYNESIKSITINFDHKKIKGIVTFHMYLANIKRYNKEFTKKVSIDNYHILDEIYPGVYYKISLLEQEVIATVLSGNIILEINGYLYKIICQNDLNRSIGESLLEPHRLLSSHDGLTENIETNLSLIQKRIKSTSLKSEQYIVGKRSNTTVNVLYINDIANKYNVSSVREKIENLNIDTLYSVNDIIYLFEKNSLFPLTAEVGSPDLVAQALNEGEICILIDQIPVAIILPVDIFHFLTLKEGNYAKPALVIYSRFFTFFCLFVSINFLAIYAAILSYHTNSLSLISISEIKSSLKGSTLPLFLEFIFLNFLFNLLRLAATKSPNINIQNVIITVGGLLIGQNAVNSGFISSFNLVIAAITYISTYAITKNQRFITAIGVVRIIVLFIGMFLGLFGVLLSMIITLFYLSNLNSLQTSYLYSVAPYNKSQFKELFLGKRIFTNKKRDSAYQPFDKTKGE